MRPTPIQKDGIFKIILNNNESFIFFIEILIKHTGAITEMCENNV